jgi:hypothetical protein
VIALDSRYSLTGVRESTTAPQEALIQRAVEVLSNDDRVLGAFLVGGFAVGLADAWSDVDFQCVITDEAAEDLAESWTDLVEEITPTVRKRPFAALVGGQRRGPIGGLCITPEWTHFDMVFNPLSKFEPSKLEGIVPLFDKTGLLPTEAIPRPDRHGEPFFPDAAVEMFFYMLGNMVSIIGRNEVIPGSNGVIMVRDIALVGLLLAEQGLTTTREHTFGNPFPFTKRLRTYLTDEQNALLATLPPVEPTIDSIIGGYLALAQAFLPRAKQLAKATDSEWPTAYEAATISYFEHSLGVKIPQ